MKTLLCYYSSQRPAKLGRIEMTRDEKEKQRLSIPATQQEQPGFPCDLLSKRWYLQLSQLKKPRASATAKEPLRTSQVFTPQVLVFMPATWVPLCSFSNPHSNPGPALAASSGLHAAQVKTTRLSPTASPHGCAWGWTNPFTYVFVHCWPATCHQPPLPCADSQKDLTASEVHVDR